MRRSLFLATAGAVMLAISGPALAFDHHDHDAHRHHRRELSRHQNIGGHHRYMHRDWGHHVHPHHPCRNKHGHWMCR
ncbi:hypothetical protein LG047_01945 [Methylocystis sp. WRRC1]|uniref:hypothetical protein n=1 Tax=Methylocystis sp. WRRC1 TaxID=1732014 RepID=UPI001D156A94|nr:hypothetical protein [Methylocystis sp. WRRC1]MCC3244092.1 hypothetical protein [Methylocystis sp. WRRC1]